MSKSLFKIVFATICTVNFFVFSDHFTEQNIAEAAQKVVYNTYHNARYGFTIQYPKGFKARQPPTNGDGLEFSNKVCTITAFGHNNIYNENAKQYYYHFVKQSIHAKITYEKVTNSFYAVSYKKGNKIFYEYLRLGIESGNTFIITYPANKQKIYGPIVSHIYNTFKTPYLNEGH